MTRGEFVEYLDREGFKYSISGDIIVIEGSSGFFPRDVNFLKGKVLQLIPGLIFKNTGNVYIEGIDNIPENIEFLNGGYVYFSSPEKGGIPIINKSVIFNNKGGVYTKGISFDSSEYNTAAVNNIWGGGIEGINNKRLLNLMVKKGIFL